MGSIERIALAITTIALITTLVLPGRESARLVKAGGDAFSGALKAAQGR